MKLPKFGKNSRIEAPGLTPSQSVSQAGSVHRAGAALANQVGNFAEQIGKQRAMADLKSDQLNFETELSEMRTKNKQQNDIAFAGTDHRGYKDKLLENDDYEANRMIESSSPFSRDHLKKLYASKRIGNAEKYSNDENSKRLDYQYGSALDNIEKMSNDLSEAPDKGKLVEGINTLENYNKISGVLFNPGRQQALKARTGSLAAAAITSLTEGNMQGLYVAKSWMDGKDPESVKIRSTLTPGQIKSFNRTIDAKILKARMLDMSKTTYNIEQDTKAFESKVLSNTATDLDIIANKERIDAARLKAANNGDLFEHSKRLERAASFMESAVNNKEFGDELRIMDLNSITKMDTTAGGVDPTDPEGSVRDMAYKAKYKQAYLDAWVKDSAGMAKSERKDLIPGSQEFYDYQVQKNSSNPSYMTNAKRESVHDHLTNSANPGKALTEFITEFPDGNGQKALAQATSKHKDLTKFVIATEFADGNTRQRLLALDKTSVSQTYVNNGNSKDSLKRDINNDIFSKFSTAMGNNSKFLSGVYDLVEVDVMDQVNRGVEQETAINTSIKRVVTDNYTHIEEYNTNQYLPVQSGVHPQDAEAFVQRYGNPNNKSGLEDLVKSKGFKLADQPGLTEGSFKDTADFVEALYDSGDFKYAIDGSRTGWKPQYVGDNGLPKAIKVKNENGGLIDLVIPWSDINMGGQLNQEILEQINREASFSGGLSDANPDAQRKLEENIKKSDPNRFTK